ncbi:hypothetical protein RSAG8_13369, partial [Rhizoctonia solani AG-8 WAC10335]
MSACVKIGAAQRSEPVRLDTWRLMYDLESWSNLCSLLKALTLLAGIVYVKSNGLLHRWTKPPTSRAGTT